MAPARGEVPFVLTVQGEERRFERYIGIDYSGAQAPDSSLKGLRVYQAEGGAEPLEVRPMAGPRLYWTRRGIAEWLGERLRESPATLVGIDHGFSFPLRYFEKYGLTPDWTAFLEDFQRHWPTDKEYMYVESVREGTEGAARARSGHSRWRRLAETRAGAKSVFHFDVPGTVAKSTHAGLPWLLYLRRQTGGRVHFWPFDGWEIPGRRSVVAEAYLALWSKNFPLTGRDPHQHDAYSIAAWMQRADADGSLEAFFRPELSECEKEAAGMEGWILGVR